MAGIHGFVGFAVDEEVPSILGKRQNGCVQCLDAKPTCPTCAEDESCTVTIPMVENCQECPQAICVKDSSKTTTSTTKSSGPNVGAIAGGVIGGLVAMALLTYLVWRFCIKNKRQKYEQENWQEGMEHTKEGRENDYASRRSQRQSTHTVHSVASTVLTRASNIIQIAYIPGVTNRATPTSPTLLVPPVPPIPLAHSDSATSSPYEEQHFFVPGDLRDSTYSGISSYTDRTSFARTSYAPRSSVASTIYGKNAVVSPLPAQRGNFLKPSIVSVKSRAPSSDSGSTTPPVPSVDYDKYDKPPPSPAFSIGATFFKNASASTATAARPQMVRVGSGPKTVDVKSASSKSSSPTMVGSSDNTPEPVLQVQDSGAVPIINNTPTMDQGPFSDPPAKMKGHHKNNSSLSTSVEESGRRPAGSDDGNHRRLSSRSAASGTRSPFGDEHAMRD
ncbi:Uu.00g103350.m01.CDS01 [Anthostomella pinea]|uniref:Uu.00g103350.m01.CDS01 n=1 Tax=Anthostomella pinea TaxID=933095 RepID=A0AAI8VDH7_9PEZI|nr:Uu.00g103350.m01.CDS01 [Anthostomella pinea]